MKKTIIFITTVILFSFSFLKAEEIKILNFSKPLEVIKFTEDGTFSVVLSRDGRILVSADQLHSWSDVLRECFPEKILDIEILSEFYIFAVGNNGLAQRTTDGGSTWNKILGLPNNTNFTKVKFVNQYVFILGENGTVLRSSDRGNSFQNFSVNTPGSFRDIVFKRSTDIAFLVSDQEPGLWVSISGGTNWESHNLPQEAIGTSISIDGRILYISGMGNMGSEYRSPLILRINSDSEDFTDWMVSPLPESFTPSGVVVKNGKGAAILNKTVGEIWKASANGMSWIPQQANRMLYSIAMRGDHVFIASDSGVIIKEGVTVGIVTNNSEAPSSYTLSQNYPNPFNPSTKINFSILKAGAVELIVYNTLGEIVSVLVNQSLRVGTYTYDFDGKNLSSGVYFYTLQSEGYTDTKSMVLIK